ncbi:hypothetical protein J6590_020264 [Homalodisca vitripennis]|nr:hypothetical protein J6590_020264 [Homalodisca vitripennis]
MRQCAEPETRLFKLGTLSAQQVFQFSHNSEAGGGKKMFSADKQVSAYCVGARVSKNNTPAGGKTKAPFYLIFHLIKNPEREEDVGRRRGAVLCVALEGGTCTTPSNQTPLEDNRSFAESRIQIQNTFTKFPSPSKTLLSSPTPPTRALPTPPHISHRSSGRFIIEHNESLYSDLARGCAASCRYRREFKTHLTPRRGVITELGVLRAFLGENWKKSHFRSVRKRFFNFPRFVSLFLYSRLTAVTRWGGGGRKPFSVSFVPRSGFPNNLPERPVS